jgi:hypothetical protein
MNLDSLKFPGGLKHAKKRRIIAVVSMASIGAELSFRLVTGFFGVDFIGLGPIGNTSGWMIGPIRVGFVLGIILMWSSIWAWHKNRGM